MAGTKDSKSKGNALRRLVTAQLLVTGSLERNVINLYKVRMNLTECNSAKEGKRRRRKRMCHLSIAY